MKYDASKEEWLPMEIKGVKGYFVDLRIDWDTVPSHIHCYELADDGSNGIPCRYRSKEIGILVDFFGSFISKGELPMDENELSVLGVKRDPEKKTIGYITSPEEFSYGDGYVFFDDIMKEFSKE